VEEVIGEAEVIIVAKLDPIYTAALTPYLGLKVIIDLVRLPFAMEARPPYYDGLCW
jgi:hypothetical protein